MSRLGEARYTNPLTITVRWDEKALVRATAEENNLTVTEVVRLCVAACLGVAAEDGEITSVEHAKLRPPSAADMRSAMWVEKLRGAKLLEAKRSRQRRGAVLENIETEE